MITKEGSILPLLGKAAVILISSLAITLLFTCRAYAAADYRKELTDWIDSENPYEDDEANQEAVDMAIEAVDSMEDRMDGHDQDSEGTIENAKKLIEEAAATSLGYTSVTKARKDANAATFMDNWYLEYYNIAQGFDIPSGIEWYDLSWGGDDAEEVEDSAMKANVLTWDRAVDRDGKTIGETYQGKLLMLINRYDSEFATFMMVIAAISVAMTLAFGTANLLTMAQDRMISSEALIREFAKIMIGVWIVLNYRYFALLIIRLGTLFTEAVFTHSTEETSNTAYQLVYKSLHATLQHYGGPTSQLANSTLTSYNIGTWWEATTDQIGNFLSKIGGNSITHFVTALTVYAIAIEITIRYVFTPIAMADLYSDRLRSNGFMWLKKLLACSMQGAIIYLIIFGTDALKTAVGGGGLAKSVINIVMMGMFALSRPIACEIVGAH